MTTSATDAAKAANALLGFSARDQEALLDVMADYFTSPEEGRDSESDEDEDEFDNGQTKLQGTAKLNVISTDFITRFKA